MSRKNVLIAIPLVFLALLSACSPNRAAEPSPPVTATTAPAPTPSPLPPTVTPMPSPIPPTATPEPPTATPEPPTATPEPPTATPSATPLPLQAHAWEAGPVLLSLDEGLCYDICGPFSPYPRLILYSDGRLIRGRWGHDALGNDRWLVEESRLTETEVCKLLNTFEAGGVLGYDPSPLHEADDAFPRMHWIAQLNVTAWDDASIPVGTVDDYRPGGMLAGKAPLDMPLLLASHLYQQLMRPAEGGNQAPYVPQALAVEVHTLGPNEDPFGCCFATEGGQWPVTAVRLVDLVAQGEPTWHARQVHTTVSGPAVEQIIAALGDDPFAEMNPISFQEDGQGYVVAIRALLPYESLASLGFASELSIIPGPDVGVGTTSLSCSPEDGVVDFFPDVVAAAERDAAILAGPPTSTPQPTPLATLGPTRNVPNDVKP